MALEIRKNAEEAGVSAVAERPRSQADHLHLPREDTITQESTAAGQPAEQAKQQLMEEISGSSDVEDQEPRCPQSLHFVAERGS